VSVVRDRPEVALRPVAEVDDGRVGGHGRCRSPGAGDGPRRIGTRLGLRK
jgi:hypothetical protein